MDTSKQVSNGMRPVAGRIGEKPRIVQETLPVFTSAA